MSRSPFSKEEKEFLKKLKEHPVPEEPETFLEKVLQEIATGRASHEVTP